VATQAARHPDGAYPSCRWIEEGLHFHDFRLGFCCTAHHGSKGWTAVGPFHGGPLPIDFLLARRIQLIRQNQAEVDNECRGCHELERRPWPTGPGLVGQMILNNYSICNMKCTYCSLAIAHFEMLPYYYLAEPAIDSLIANGWLAPGAQLTWGGGEPGVSREFQAITSKLLATGCRFAINTNATRVVPAIEDALRQGRCDLMISVDSGTPETFYRFKFNSDHAVQIDGRPAFNSVWETIARYAGLSQDSVTVKYIFMPTNIEEADIRGFVDRCLAHGVGRVMLTPEFSDVSAGAVAPEVWTAIARTRVLAEAHGLTVLFSPLDPSNPSMPAGL
jgi:sulfatase maturation enzyme AslB (radical SAM superfamily)